MNPDDFLKEHPPKIRQSRLTPAWPAIQKMRALGSSLADIKAFLEENGIKTSVPNLSLFIKRQVQADGEKAVKAKLGTSEKDAGLPTLGGSSETPDNTIENVEGPPETGSDAATSDQALEKALSGGEQKSRKLHQEHANNLLERFATNTPKPKEGNS